MTGLLTDSREWERGREKKLPWQEQEAEEEEGSSVRKGLVTERCDAVLRDLARPADGPR